MGVPNGCDGVCGVKIVKETRTSPRPGDGFDTLDTVDGLERPAHVGQGKGRVRAT